MSNVEKIIRLILWTCSHESFDATPAKFNLYDVRSDIATRRSMISKTILEDELCILLHIYSNVQHVLLLFNISEADILSRLLSVSTYIDLADVDEELEAVYNAFTFIVELFNNETSIQLLTLDKMKIIEITQELLSEELMLSSDDTLAIIHERFNNQKN
jgi:hypothetical protein